MGQEQELKWKIQDELRKVRMKTPVKALMWDLLSRVDPKTGIIPARHTPSLTDLEGSTCLGRSTLTTYLRALEATGWVARERPSAADSLGHGQRTLYRLAIGSLDLPKVLRHEKHKRKPRKDAAGGSGDGLGQEMNQRVSGDDLAKGVETGRDSSGDDLPASATRSGDDLELGQEMTPTRSGDDLNKEPPTGVPNSSVHQDSSPPSGGDADAPQQPPLIDDESTQPPSKPKRKRTKSEETTVPEDFPITPEMRAYAAEKCPDVKDLEFHTEQFLLHHGAKGSKHKNWVMAWQRWIRNEQKWASERQARAAPRGDWRDVSGQDHSGWTKRADNRAVSAPEAIETGWNRKGTTQ